MDEVFEFDEKFGEIFPVKSEKVNLGRFSSHWLTFFFPAVCQSTDMKMSIIELPLKEKILSTMISKFLFSSSIISEQYLQSPWQKFLT